MNAFCLLQYVGEYDEGQTQDHSNQDSQYPNRITDISLLANLTSLKELDIAENMISDYSPLANLQNLERLGIGGNGSGYTDLSPLKNLINLTSISAHWCGIDDISALKDMTELTYINFFNNSIVDISLLGDLEKLEYVELGMNKINDITPLYNLQLIAHINLRNNPIPEDMLEEYYRPKANDYFTTVFRQRICDNMPEYDFKVFAYFNRSTNGYTIEQLTITNASTGSIIQEILIPKSDEYLNTSVPTFYRDTMGLDFEDYNFDGYIDMSLLKHQGGTSGNMPRFYWLWDNDTEQYVSNSQLEELSDVSWIGVEREKKQITSNVRYNIGYETWYYEYISGEYVVVKSEESRLDDSEWSNGIVLWRTIISEVIDGEMVVTEEFYENITESYTENLRGNLQ